MPHLVILYTAPLDAESDMGALCRRLGDTMLAARDEAGQQVFPTGGTRVLAYPAAHSAVADGRQDYLFAYMNLRMAKGRSDAVKKQIGEVLLAAAKAHFEPVLARRYLGLTLQVDEGQEAFNGVASTIHPLFNKA
ncbi:MAG TPA: 5-carboxymethyl-2-hydroxymuconate Delta-isomerase [Rubrivivax sp.]